jgi:hypothetical protein
MTTPLEKPLRRAVMIGREPWVVTITPAGLKLTRKGARKGQELGWADLVSGDAALAAALNASIRTQRRRSTEIGLRRRASRLRARARRS